MRKDIFIGLSIFILVLGLYLFSGYSTVAPYRDSGDLAAAAYTLGISHPPGYVLYVLLGKIAVHGIPWGDIAFRLNGMSILFGALAVLFLYLVLRQLTTVGAALAGAVCFALSPALWRLSQVSEMYSLNVCMGVFILWWLLKEDDIRKAVWIGALFCGLGLTNHQTLMFFFPGYLYLIWKKFPAARNIRSLWPIVLMGIVFFMIGISVYAFLPIRSMTEPYMDSGDPETFRNFWRMISRSDYGILKLHPQESMLSWTIGGIYQQILFFSKALISQFGFMGISMGLVGIWYAWKRKLLDVTMLLFAVSGPGFILLANLPVENVTSLPILEANLLMPSLIWGVWIGMGVHYIAEKGRIFKTVSKALVVVLVGVGFLHSFTRGVYNRGNYLSYDYGKNILRSMKPGSILYNPDDPTAFITEYLKIAYNYRRDIRTFVYFRTLWGYHRLKKLYPSIMPEGQQDNAQEMLNLFFKKNIGSIPLYADLPIKFPERFKTVPQGLVYQLVSDKEKESISIEKSKRMLSLYPFRTYKGLCAPDSFFSRQILSYYTAAYNNTGIELLSLKQYDEARKHYFKSLTLNLSFKEGWSNLGALEYRLNNYDKALDYFRMVLRIDENDVEGWYHVGLVLKKMKKHDDALEAFGNVPREGKYGAYMLNESGLIFLSQGNYKKAVEDFMQAINIYPSYTLPYYNVGLAYQKMGDISHAISAYQAYHDITFDPSEKAEVKILIDRLRRI